MRERKHWRARSNHAALFYPALNRMAAELIVDAGKPGWAGFDPAALAEVTRQAWHAKHEMIPISGVLSAHRVAHVSGDCGPTSGGGAARDRA